MSLALFFFLRTRRPPRSTRTDSRFPDTTRFRSALRAIGEPIFGLPSRDVSMGRLLAQLFQVTEQFEMRTRPELILLQKTMVVIEGVARHFDPDNNIWDSAEPVLRTWMTEQFAPETRIEEAVTGAAQLGRMAGNLPEDRKSTRLNSSH